MTGISLDLSTTRAWVSTAPVAWSRADRRCGAEARPRRAPRTVLPSTAMTVLPSTVPVRVHNHDLRRVLRSVGSRSCSTRRMDDCRRQGLPRLQAQGPQIRRGQVGGVLPDGRQAPAACEHSRHGQGQDREQAVAHAPPIPGGAPMWCVKRRQVVSWLVGGRRVRRCGSWRAGSGCGGGPGRGRPGPRRFALVSFALVVGPGDGVGAQGGEGGQEHGALEPLVAAVGDVLAPYGGA